MIKNIGEYMAISEEINDPYKGYRTTKTLDHSLLPEPVFDQNPAFVELYWKAWDIAWSHVLERNDTPQPRYMDPGMNPGTTWIWDTCFMALYCRYAFDVFPGIESLNNFYFILYDHKPTKIHIHFVDNPPLFAWVESEYLKLTGDRSRIQWLFDHHYLEQHFDFIDHARSRPHNPAVYEWPITQRTAFGYPWRGNTSGMDNTPRGRSWCNNFKIGNSRGQITFNHIYWVDLMAQQALVAESIQRLAELIEETAIANQFNEKYLELKTILNQFYWDNQDGFYYDLRKYPAGYLRSAQQRHRVPLVKVPTPASYWPMLAGVTDASQAQLLAEKAADPKWFGTPMPWTSVAQHDPEFDPRGRYWRGGVWLPTAYMGTKALERFHYYSTADLLAERLLTMMVRTYKQFDPHSIWECYLPTEAKPATQKRNIGFGKDEFCGWSALGPISLFIENVIGIHEINTIQKFIKWNIHHEDRHGINHLHFGENYTDLIFENNIISVRSDQQYSLILTDSTGQEKQHIAVESGSQDIEIQ